MTEPASAQPAAHPEDVGHLGPSATTVPPGWRGHGAAAQANGAASELVDTARTGGDAAGDQDAGSPAPAKPSLFRASATMWGREMIRFRREPSRIASAVGSPLILWLMLGFGLDELFVLPEGGASTEAATIGYAAYFFPGIVTLTILFSAIFTTITVIEDRQAGFLQGVLVAPVSRLAIVLGKVAGGASIAMIYGVMLLLLWPTVGPLPGVLSVAGAVAAMAVMALGLTALGLCIAWRMSSTAGFHAVMMLALMPMWFLSGAVFPVQTAPWFLQALMWLNPLTYGHAAMAGHLLGEATLPLPLWVTSGISLGITAGLIALATLLVSRRRSDAAC